MVQKLHKREHKKNVSIPGKRKQIIWAQFSIEFLKELEQKSEPENINLDCRIYRILEKKNVYQ